MGEVRIEGTGGLRETILRVIREGTVLHGTSLMTEEMKREAHESQMVANLLDAIEPLIEQKGPAAQSVYSFRRFGDAETTIAHSVDEVAEGLRSDGIDQRVDELFRWSQDDLDALADRVGDLESWRASLADKNEDEGEESGIHSTRLRHAVLRGINSHEARAPGYKVTGWEPIYLAKSITDVIKPFIDEEMSR